MMSGLVGICLSLSLSAGTIELGPEANPHRSMPDLMRVSQLISERVETLALEFPEAAEKCKDVLATRRNAREGDQPSAWQGMSESELRQLERTDWLTCGAAIRLIRESGETEGLEILDEICPQFGELASVRLFHPYPMYLYLGLECSDAYVSVLFGGKSAAEIVKAWRDHVVWLYDTGNRRHGDPRRQAIGGLGCSRHAACNDEQR